MSEHVPTLSQPLHLYLLCAGVLEASGMEVDETVEKHLQHLLQGEQTPAQAEAQLLAILERLRDGS